MRAPTRNMMILFLGLALSACASVPKVILDPKTNPQHELARLSEEFDAGLEAQLDVLDVDDFNAAQAQWRQARDLIGNKADSSEVLQALGYAHAYLNKATSRAAQLQEWTQEILDARAKALHAGVRSFPDQAADLRRRDIEFIDRVPILDERKVAADAKAGLQQGYLNLELRGIQSSKLADVRSSIARARQLGAQQLAPLTLSQAEVAMEEARNVIAVDRHNEALTTPAITLARSSAGFLTQVMAAVHQPDGVVSETVAATLIHQTKRMRDLKSKVSAEDQKVFGRR